MFLVKMKEFLVKKKVKNSLKNYKHIFNNSSVKTIGVIIDTDKFRFAEDLINKIVKSKYNFKEVSFLIFNNQKLVNSSFESSVFSNKNLNWDGSFNNNDVNQFLSRDFDLLISYYEEESAINLRSTYLSKAKFKVGFATIDNRLNQFIISSPLNEYKIFIEELFKYLEILKKI